MEVEDVDVVGVELLEGVSNGQVQGLLRVARVGRRDVLVGRMRAVVSVPEGQVRGSGRKTGQRRKRGLKDSRSVLGCEDDSISDISLLHPLSNPLLRLLVLVAASGVDEVAAVGKQSSQDWTLSWVNGRRSSPSCSEERVKQLGKRRADAISTDSCERHACRQTHLEGRFFVHAPHTFLPSRADAL